MLVLGNKKIAEYEDIDSLRSVTGGEEEPSPRMTRSSSISAFTEGNHSPRNLLSPLSPAPLRRRTEEVP